MKRLIVVWVMILCLMPFGVSAENAAPTQPPAPPDQWPEVTPEPKNLRTETTVIAYWRTGQQKS